MGKQINYWMDYNSFLMIAQKAVDLGCTILKEDLALGKVTESNDVGIVTPHGKFCQSNYYFHLPEAGKIQIQTVNGREFLDSAFSAASNALIEANFSFIINEPSGFSRTKRKKEIRRARIYCITGYYDKNEKYIPRPECLARVYNALARYVKKIAPYTEFTDERTSIRDENYGEKYVSRYKIYITKSCLDLVNNEGYKIC